MIRHRRIEPFVKLIRMSFRARNCRVRAAWPIMEAHYRLIIRYAGLEKGQRGQGGELDPDPFAKAIIDERWDDVPALVKGELLKAAGIRDGV